MPTQRRWPAWLLGALLGLVLGGLPGQVLAQDACDCALALELRPGIAAHWIKGELEAAEQLINRVGEQKALSCQVFYLDSRAQLAISRKQHQAVRPWLAQEVAAMSKQDCPKAWLKYYNTCVRFYQEISLPDSASWYAYQVLGLAEQEDDWYAYARASINLAVIQSQLGDKRQAITWYQKGAEAAYRAKDSILVCSALSRTASALYGLYKQNHYRPTLDSAYQVAVQTVAIAKKHSLLDLLDAYDVLAFYHTELKEYEQALAYADEMIAIAPPGVHDFQRLLNAAYMHKSDLMLAQGQQAQAAMYADSALLHALAFNPQTAARPLERLYVLRKEAGQYEAALQAFESWQLIKDTIFSQERRRDIAELEKQYNQSRNEQTISRLQTEKKLLYALAGLVVVALVLGYFYYRNRLLQQKQLILETEQRLNRARMNPHFFFNALSSLQSFVMNESDAILLAENLSKFSHIMRETLENTYREYVTIRQEMDFLSEYLELQQMRFPDKFTFEMSCDKDLDKDALLIPSMIVQPFIENCIEHGFKNIDYLGYIRIKLYKQGQSIQVEVSDNGQGLNYGQSPAKPYISRASQIIKDRIFLLNLKLKTNASFSITNHEQGSGVVVLIKLPAIYES